MQSRAELLFFLLFGFASGGGCWNFAQVVPPPLANPPVTPLVLSPGDRSLLEPLPLLNRIETERTFDGQNLRIQILQFSSPESAFSAFTCLQRSGAKSYEGLADCVVQEQEMVSWKGTRVTRTSFPDIARAHLSTYARWIRDQFRQTYPIPQLYLKFPSQSLLAPSRRYLVRDFQVGGVWAGFPPGFFSLDRGNRLIVGHYRSPQHEYWGGWLIAANGPAGRKLAPMDGYVPDDSQNWVFRIRCDGNVCSVYLGPDVPRLAADALREFQECARGDPLTAEVDTNQFFRRDQYTYPDVILTGFRLVFFLLTGAFVAGLVIGGARMLWKKVLRRETGLAEETVTCLRLETKSDGMKKNHTPPRDFL